MRFFFLSFFFISFNSYSQNKIVNWSGTGFAISSNGYILTNYHVINRASNIQVKGVNGDFSKVYNAEVVVSDNLNDLAIIKIEDSNFTSFPVIPYNFRHKTAEIGEEAYTLGYPMIDEMGSNIKLTNGIISAKSGYKDDVTSYQITVSVQPGNSGGPLFDKSGDVIGIVNAGLPERDNVGYAIKINCLENLISQVNGFKLPAGKSILKDKNLASQVKLLNNFVFQILVSSDEEDDVPQIKEDYSEINDIYSLEQLKIGMYYSQLNKFDLAVVAFENFIFYKPNFGPIYKELAEIYFRWANNSNDGKYEELIKKGLVSYQKYMSVSKDYSVSSLMRYADFLMLSKSYKILEIEANKMKNLAGINPRILRYLGYSAYENGNPDAAITALNEFINKGTNKVISGDYFYLGLATVKKSVGADMKTVDPTVLASGIANVKKAVDAEPSLANALNEIGKKYFTEKVYDVSAAIFEIAISNPNSKNFLEDNIYYGLAAYTVNRGKDLKDRDVASLQKADLAMDAVIVASPTYLESYLYKARINSSLEKDDVMAATYQKYLDLVLAKGGEEVTKNKAKVTESYNSIAAFYANTDKAKAKEFFNKTLALDPTNTYALDSLKLLK
jgi:hypothetical protein